MHDSLLVGYTVDGNARRIVLRTERHEPNRPVALIDAVFEGLEAYAFRHDCLGNIIDAIYERPLAEALRAHWTELSAGYRASGWPRFWDADDAKARASIAQLAGDGAKWFELTSSYGMDGWVICRSLEYRTSSP